MTNVQAVNDIIEEFADFKFESHRYPNPIGLWPNEQESLVWLALEADPSLDWIEIGAFCGGSACLLCLSRLYQNAGPSVISVDHDFTHSNGAFDKNVYFKGGFGEIHRSIRCNSKDFLTKYTGQASFGFIDGWHSFSAVLADALTLDSVMAPGGILAIHDCAPQPYSKQQLAFYYEKSKHLSRASDLEQVGPAEDKESYHESEANQDFFVDEAVAVLINEYNYQLIDIPVLDGSTHFDRVPIYKHGTTSPYHGLVGLRKTK